MAFKDPHTPSIGAKLSLLILTLVGIILSILYLVQKSEFKIIILICSLFFYIRLIWSLFVFVKRKVSWFEGISVGILYGLLVFAFMFWGSKPTYHSGFILTAGMVLFLGGSFINSLSDYQRFAWKKQPGNQGKIYTLGLFHYAMHINFFGDMVMFLGFAMVTQNYMSFIPVMGILLNFIFVQIPALDQYLKEKYGKDFMEYAGRTKKFIPFVY